MTWWRRASGLSGKSLKLARQACRHEKEMDTAKYQFGAHQRLKSTAEFDAVYNRKKSAADGLMIVFGKRSDLPHPRVGLSVSKKHGSAPVRNRIKRILREAFRTLQHELPAGVDFVIVPRVGPPLELAGAKLSLQILAGKVAKRLEPLPRTEDPA